MAEGPIQFESTNINPNTGNTISESNNPVSFEDLSMAQSQTEMDQANTDNSLIQHQLDDSREQAGSTEPVQESNLAKINFSIPNLRKFMNDRSLNAFWERSYLCPCRNPETLASKMDCPICEGTGVAYLPGKPLKVAIQEQQRDPRRDETGVNDAGTAIGTAQLNERLGRLDRISLPDVLVNQSYIFNVTENRLNKGVRIPYDVTKFTLVRTLDGYLDDGTDYEYDNKNRWFKIINPKLLGMNITLNMVVTLRYIVVDLLKESRYQYTAQYIDNGVAHFDNLPQKLRLKRENVLVKNAPFVPPTAKSNASRADQMNDTASEMTNTSIDPDINAGLEGFGLNLE